VRADAARSRFKSVEMKAKSSSYFMFTIKFISHSVSLSVLFEVESPKYLVRMQTST
jgi:hypothetical protein